MINLYNRYQDIITIQRFEKIQTSAMILKQQMVFFRMIYFPLFLH